MKWLLVSGAVALACAVAAAYFWAQLRRMRRTEFIRDFNWPPGLLDKLQAKHTGFTRKESALVGNGLRQFFQAYLMGGCRYVAMPSQVVDDLWHEFILYTRAYDAFCAAAFGGFLHHTPARALAPEKRQSNEGLRRVWWWSCKDENIDPVRPTRLPILFALDKKLRIPGGFHYSTDCSALRKAGVASGYCGGDFGDSSIDGSTSGMGDGGGGIDAGGGDSGGGGASGDSGGGDSGGGGCGGGD